MNYDYDEEKRWLTDTLTRQIPLGGAMGLEVERLDDQGLVLNLPLAPNINDKGTAFGGSMSSALILAGWSLPRLILRRERRAADLVIGRCELRFLAPVDTGFRAISQWPDPGQINEFLIKLDERGKAALAMEPEIRVDDSVAATLSARYAALVKSIA
ncbi:MAG: YiiD C-terminal domain-containing protein [Pseudomonadota bacterium]